MTGNVARVLPFHVLLPVEESGLAVVSKAQAEQVRWVDVTRLINRVGRVPPSLVADLDTALRLHLSL